VLGKDGGERFGGAGRVKNEPGAFSIVTRQVTAPNRNCGNSMAGSLSRGTRACASFGAGKNEIWETHAKPGGW
jgi:hypothetical protein